MNISFNKEPHAHHNLIYYTAAMIFFPQEEVSTECKILIYMDVPINIFYNVLLGV